MKKIIPSVIFTVAAAAGTILYIKKKFIEKNEIKLIELEEDNQESNNIQDCCPPRTYQSDEDIQENLKEQQDISNIDLSDEEVEENNEQDESIETQENLEQQQDISNIDLPDEEIKENNEQTESIQAQEDLEEQSDDLSVEKTENENLIDNSINDEINNIIDEIIQPQDEDEEVTIEEENQLLNQDNEEIEEAINDDEIDLVPLEDPTDELKIIDENKVEENLIDDIVNSLDEDDQNQQAVSDIEDIIDDEIEEIKEEDMTDEELIEYYSRQYPNISSKKIDLILKQIKLMQESVGPCDSISLLHYAIFDNKEQKDAYKAVAQIEGYEEEAADNENKLNLINVIENNRLALNHSILALASNINEYHGSYRGWAVINKTL